MSGTPHNGREESKNVRFFKLCNALKQNKEYIDHVGPTRVRMAEILSRQLGFEVTTHYLAEAIAATGVTWEPVHGGKVGSSPGGRTMRLMVIMQAVYNLYEQLGLATPSTFQLLYDFMSGKKGVTDPTLALLEAEEKKLNGQTVPEDQAQDEDGKGGAA